jgi:hypothetical protein
MHPAYFNWKNFEEFQMYSQYNTNAEKRFKAIQVFNSARIKELLIVWKPV